MEQNDDKMPGLEKETKMPQGEMVGTSYTTMDAISLLYRETL